MKALKYLNRYFLKYKWHITLGVVFVSFSNIFAIFPAQIIRYAFDIVRETVVFYRLLEGFENQINIYEQLSLALIMFGALVLLMALLKGAFLFLTRQTLIVMSRLIEYDLKNTIYSHYQDLDLSFYKAHNTGDLMNRISEDVSRVRMYLGPAIMYFLNMITLFIMILITMLSVNVKLTLLVLSPLPLLSISIYYVSNLINKRSEQVQRQLSVMSSFVQEAFSGIRVLKAYSREKSRKDEFSSEANAYKDTNLKLVKINALFMPLMILLIGLSTIITIYVGGQLTLQGEISTGNIAEFVIYVNQLTWPIAALGWLTSITQRAAASQERINEFLDTKPLIANNNTTIEEIKGEITFDKVSYSYPNSEVKAIDQVSFHIPSGTTLAIIGKTGSGKSTLANLIGRLYDINEGEIRIDKESIEKVNLAALRTSIGYVPQEVFLFSDTIENNIGFGLKTDERGSERIMQAAKDAEVYESIAGFEEGFKTKVGERGITLSGGQKQRISIARAIIKEPKILIFDDCLSAVDTKTEESIIRNLKRIMADRTTIIISHRVSSVKHADQIIVLDDGKILEQGNHSDLLENQGIYHELFQQQLLEDASVS